MRVRRSGTMAMKWFSKLGSPVALAVQGFLAVALVFVAAHPVVLHPGKADASAQSDAIYRELTR
jgi:poly-gamma-glutamate capsule biosynthesis protein CapA/YwtB (metallophosphatase superfamily)